MLRTESGCGGWPAEGGHLEVLQWARANGCPWNRDLCVETAEYCGNNDVEPWIEAQPLGSDEESP